MPLRTLAKRCKRFTPLLAAPAALLLTQGEAKAVLTYNIFESGGDVILRTSGSLTLPNAKVSTSFNNPQYNTSPANFTLFSTGPRGGSGQTYLVQGPGTIPGSSNFTGSGTGLNTSMQIGSYFTAIGGSQVFSISTSYTGGEIISEAVFSGKTLANFGITSLGLIGTWTLQPKDGSDPYTANDTIQLIAGAPSTPSASVPGPLPLLGAGAAFGWSRRLRKRIAAPLSTPPKA